MVLYNINLISVYLENIIKKNKLIVLLTLYGDDILITGEDKEINFTVDKLKKTNTQFQKIQMPIKLLV